MNHPNPLFISNGLSDSGTATLDQLNAHEAMPASVPGFCLSAYALREKIGYLVDQAIAGREEMTFMIDRSPMEIRLLLEKLRGEFTSIGLGLDFAFDESSAMRDWAGADRPNSDTPRLENILSYEAMPASVPGFCLSAPALRERIDKCVDHAMKGAHGSEYAIAMAPHEMRPLLKRWRMLFASIGRAADATADDIGVDLNEVWAFAAQ